MTKAETLTLHVGGRVYCTVHGVQGYYTVTAIRPRDGYIKIGGVTTWNPPHNFVLTAPSDLVHTMNQRRACAFGQTSAAVLTSRDERITCPECRARLREDDASGQACAYCGAVQDCREDCEHKGDRCTEGSSDAEI